MAKLAAHAALFHNKKTAVITADTYRIGAVDQLRTYADILNVPLDVVITPEEMAKAINSHQDKDASSLIRQADLPKMQNNCKN